MASGTCDCGLMPAGECGECRPRRMTPLVPDRSWLNDGDRDRYYSRPRRTAFGFELRCIDVGEPAAYNGTAIDLADGRELVFYRGGGSWPGTRLRYVILPGHGGRPRPRDAGLIGNDEDPRTVFHNGKLLVTTAKFANDQVWMELWNATLPDGNGEVHFEPLGQFKTVHDWPGYVKPRFEKNWAPFSHDGRLFYVYSARPHRVLEVDLHAGRVRLAMETDGRAVRCHGLDDPDTDIRLNAPPVRLADGRYLSTYHVARQVGRAFDYYTGFYTFAGEPPFEPLQSTGALLLPEDAEGIVPHDDRPTRCVFVTGLKIDEAADQLTLWGGDTDRRVFTANIGLSHVMRELR